MRYLPHSEKEVKEMLSTIGVGSVDELFGSIPAEHRARSFPLPDPVGEEEVKREFERMASSNRTMDVVLAGAGAYFHHVPEAVFHVISRTEFMTAYTPYQPEVSQGTLQAMFEFQTMVSELMGLEVANASLYDGATALGEAVLMAHRLLKGKRRKVLVSRALGPLHLRAMLTYLESFSHIEVEWLDWDGGTGQTIVPGTIGEDVFAIAVGYPNFFGIVEDLAAFARLAEGVGAHLIAYVPDPALLSVLEAPGALGATIAVGEGAGLAGFAGMGGPGVGLMATTRKAVKQLPGRLVGKTVDVDGREGYVLTLSSREQHIRRERATSNICSNQALVALAFAVNVALQGHDGLYRMATLGARRLGQILEILKDHGARVKFSGPYINETVVTVPSAREIHEKALAHGVLLGVPLSTLFGRGFEDDLLVCATELVTERDLDRVREALS